MEQAYSRTYSGRLSLLICPKTRFFCFVGVDDASTPVDWPPGQLVCGSLSRVGNLALQVSNPLPGQKARWAVTSRACALRSPDHFPLGVAVFSLPSRERWSSMIERSTRRPPSWGLALFYAAKEPPDDTLQHPGVNALVLRQLGPHPRQGALLLVEAHRFARLAVGLPALLRGRNTARGCAPGPGLDGT